MQKFFQRIPSGREDGSLFKDSRPPFELSSYLIWSEH